MLVRIFLLGLGITLALSQAASAEMGKAPVGPGGLYGGLTVGVLQSDEPETRFNTTAGVTFHELDPDAGLQGGLQFGYVLPQPLLGLENFRIEGALSFTSSSDDTFSPLLPFIISADGGVIIGAGGTTVASQESSRVDGSVAFKGDMLVRDGFVLPVGLEIFVSHTYDRTSLHRADGLVPNILFGKIDADYYGIMGVLEPEFQLDDRISVVLRLAGGIYGYDFDGRFGGNGSTQEVNDSDDGIGARAEVLGGLKLVLSETFTLTLFGGFEYWSETPIANYPEVALTTAFVDRTDLFAVKAGITATVALGGQ